MQIQDVQFVLMIQQILQQEVKYASLVMLPFLFRTMFALLLFVEMDWSLELSFVMMEEKEGVFQIAQLQPLGLLALVGMHQLLQFVFTMIMITWITQLNFQL